MSNRFADRDTLKRIDVDAIILAYNSGRTAVSVPRGWTVTVDQSHQTRCVTLYADKVRLLCVEVLRSEVLDITGPLVRMEREGMAPSAAVERALSALISLSATGREIREGRLRESRHWQEERERAEQENVIRALARTLGTPLKGENPEPAEVVSALERIEPMTLASLDKKIAALKARVR